MWKVYDNGLRLGWAKKERWIYSKLICFKTALMHYFCRRGFRNFQRGWRGDGGLRWTFWKLFMFIYIMNAYKYITQTNTKVTVSVFMFMLFQSLYLKFQWGEGAHTSNPLLQGTHAFLKQFKTKGPQTLTVTWVS